MNRWCKHSVLILLTGCLLSSCLDSAETTDQTFARIVTVENNNGVVQLIPDFQNAVLTPEVGVTTVRLQNAKRAMAVFTMKGQLKEGEPKTVKLEDVYCNPIKVNGFCLRPDTLGNYINTIANFQKVQLNMYTSYPAAWIAKNYLNIGVSYSSGKRGSFQLVADTVSNDTLYLKIKAKFEKTVYTRQDYICYDFKTLTQNSGNAAYQKKLDAISKAIESLRADLIIDKLYVTLTSGVRSVDTTSPSKDDVLVEPENDPNFSSYTTVVKLNSNFGL